MPSRRLESVGFCPTLGIETRVLKNPGPGETRTFCQTRNPGLDSPQNPRVSGLRFCTKSAADDDGKSVEAVIQTEMAVYES